MSKRDIKLFYEEIASNSDMVKQLSEIINSYNVCSNDSVMEEDVSREILKFAKGHGYSFTLDELDEYHNEQLDDNDVNKIIGGLKTNDSVAQICDDDIEAVVGGVGVTSSATSCTGSIGLTNECTGSGCLTTKPSTCKKFGSVTGCPANSTGYGSFTQS